MSAPFTRYKGFAEISSLKMYPKLHEYLRSTGCSRPRWVRTSGSQIFKIIGKKRGARQNVSSPLGRRMIVAISSLRPSWNNADEWHFTVGENQCWHSDTRLDRLWCNCVDTLPAAVPQFPAKMTTSFLMMRMSWPDRFFFFFFGSIRSTFISNSDQSLRQPHGVIPCPLKSC